jgi:hypothetical protein
MLGGGGMLGYGLNPGGVGSWTGAAQGYYGGYPTGGNNTTNIDGGSYNSNIHGPNNSWHGKNVY